jgi:V/A-type H+-transporting ATPase subunit F
MNYKISIVGTREAILGFKALGLEPHYVSEPEAAVESLYNLKKERTEHEGESKNKYAIIFIMEDLMSAITDDDYKKLTADPLPAIIPLPSHLGSSGFGLKKLKTIVEKAVGMDILN